MGIVYLARDTKLDRLVALKSIPAEIKGNSQTWLRLKREAKVLAQLNHPNIAAIYDQIDDVDGTAYLVLEYVPGQALAHALKQGPVDLSVAMSLAQQIAAGLAVAHAQGVIHRDLKPGNIMCTPDDHIKILDFGLAKTPDPLDSDAPQWVTQPGSVIGTVAYMSPEQINGEAVDVRTDLWSLGVILYQLFCGKHPFAGANVRQTKAAIRDKDPSRPISHVPSIPVPWENLILRLLSKPYDDRPKDINEVLAVMESISGLSGDSIMHSYKNSPSIAVLPFANMSSDTEQDYFCDGIAEELINALTQFRDVRVIARTSAFSFKGKQIPIRDIGRQLNVANVLDGSVRKSGNRLRITAQLVNTAQDQDIWSESYNREVGDVFAIQDEITTTIVDKLKPQLLGGEKDRLAQHQPNLEAYKQYLKGCYFRARGTPGALESALHRFHKAIEIDPAYAMAYAGIALSYGLLPFYSATPPCKAIPIAEDFIQRALQHEPDLPEAHGCLGFIKAWYEWNWSAAEQAIKHAIRKKPGSDRFHLWYAHYLMLVGRYAEAIQAIDHALELDPVSVVLNRDRGIIYYCAAQYEQATEMLEKTIEMDPYIMYAHSHLGATLVAQGKYSEAMEVYAKEKKIARGCHTWPDMLEGLAYMKMGQETQTRAALEALLQRSQKTYVSPFHLACLYFELQQDDRGFAALKAAYEGKDNCLGFLKVMPAYDRIRNDPRMVEILSKMQLVDM